MASPPVSVVVVSRDRPDALARCLSGLGQLFYHPYEVVIVADPAGLGAVTGHALARRVKTVAFDEANIAAARNAGIAAAGGDVIAFIDDDAVPEPTWLDHLVAPISTGRADLVGGFVLGRNGIGFQWRARLVDFAGQTVDVACPGRDPFLPVPADGGAVKTEGTNMAVLRTHLSALGGFDPRYRFYLDETDLNLRSARAGGRTVLIPMAQVHHGFFASPRRRADRMPLSLHDIGASAEVFWATHTPPEKVEAARRDLIADQRARLTRHLIAGTCEPRDMRRLLAGLNAGMEAGRARASAPPQWPEFSPTAAFSPLHAEAPPHDMRFLGGRSHDERRLLDEATAAVAAGGRASVTVLERGFRRHWVRFTPQGVWLQKGGIWGRSVRDRRVGRVSLDDRLAAERRRVAGIRTFTEVGDFSQRSKERT